MAIMLVPHTIKCKSCESEWTGVGKVCPFCGSVAVEPLSYTMSMSIPATADPLYRNVIEDEDGNRYHVADYGCLVCWHAFNEEDWDNEEGCDGVQCPACGSKNILRAKPA